MAIKENLYLPTNDKIKVRESNDFWNKKINNTGTPYIATKNH